MSNNFEFTQTSITLEQLSEIYRNAFISIGELSRMPKLKIEFYPYVGVNSRVRVREDWLIVRISDVLIDAPAEFHQSLANILIRKLFRRRALKNDLQIYNDYLKQSHVHEKSVDNRRTRGRKIITTSKGEFYDLDNIFLFLNNYYFENSLPKPVLTWSAKKTFRILGHHDSTHSTIVISKSLDDKKIPRFVVEYVVYHEMLHIKHPTVQHNGRRYNHTPAFRRDEEKFAYFEEAERWIEQNASALRRRAKR